jgi:hypothetical protein
LQIAVLSQQVVSLNSTALSAASTLQGYLSSLKTKGAASPVLATGSYAWIDVNIVDDGSDVSPLTNDQCAIFMSRNSQQAEIKSRLATEMAKTLAVPASSIVFGSGNVTCSPQYRFQTLGDQLALFSVSFNISAPYTSFARGAVHVIFANSSVDRSIQLEAMIPRSEAVEVHYDTADK